MLSKDERERAIDLYVKDVRDDLMRWAIDGNIPEIDHFILIHLDPDSLDDDTLLSVLSHHLDEDGNLPRD